MNERLKAAEAALRQAEVVDVKFTFNTNMLASLPHSEAAGKLADFLDAYAAGKARVIDTGRAV